MLLLFLDAALAAFLFMMRMRAISKQRVVVAAPDEKGPAELLPNLTVRLASVR